MKRILNNSALRAASLAACAVSAFGQSPAPVVMEIDGVNCITYVYDTSDVSKYGTVMTPTTSTLPNGGHGINVCDISKVNGQPAAGGLSAVLHAANGGRFLNMGWDIRTPDGKTIGGIAGNVFTIHGGWGAFSGVRGSWQTVAAGFVPLPVASITESPSIRQTRGGTLGAFRWIMQIIPAQSPTVIATPNGPAVTHSSDASLVSAAKPAAKGETLSLFAVGFGFIANQPANVPALAAYVVPGQPFSANPLTDITAAVGVTVNGKPATVLSATGYPGSTDGFQVNFRVPPDAASGAATVVVSSAWIPGPPVTININ